MEVVVGLLLGAGVACVWWSFWPRAPKDRPDGWTVRMQDELVQAGVTGVTPGGLAFACVVVGLTTVLVVTGATRAPTVGLFFGLFASAAPVGLVRARARRRRARLRELWPEVVDHLASGIRAGLSMPEAVAQVGERGPLELRDAFRAFGEDYRATGRFGDSLDSLKARLADPVADRIVEALRLTRDVGGTDLGRLLRTLSGFLREDVRTRGELEARQSWTVYAARLAVAAPWIVLALLTTQPAAAHAYDGVAGFLVLLVGGAVSLIAYQIMRRIARLPEDPRVLR